LILVIYLIKQILFIYFTTCPMMRQTPAPMPRRLCRTAPAARRTKETSHAYLYAARRRAL